MTIKPVGRERDRQIVELKGLCWHETEDAYTCKHCGMKALMSLDSNTAWNREINPYYSTSLTNAWELWEEMKKEKDTMALDLNYDSCRTKDKSYEVLCEKELSESLFRGTTEADAISGAWVEWKLQ